MIGPSNHSVVNIIGCVIFLSRENTKESVCVCITSVPCVHFVPKLYCLQCNSFRSNGPALIVGWPKLELYCCKHNQGSDNKERSHALMSAHCIYDWQFSYNDITLRCLYDKCNFQPIDSQEKLLSVHVRLSGQAESLYKESTIESTAFETLLVDPAKYEWIY